MRFKKITIENFGPFKKPAVIDFKDRDGVSIVWGYNGRGKTTILNAFNFVLNETVKDRDGKENDFISFINEEGWSEGKYSFKVVLDIEDEGKKYRVIRSLEVMPGVSVPTSNNDVYTHLMVNESGNILSDADAEHFMKGIMTKEVSRFFLFDGELLTEYEELLNENSETGGSIKNSIEQILGIPILTFGAIDADLAAASIETDARKVAQNEKTVTEYTNKLNIENDKLIAQTQEKKRLEEERDKLIVEQKQLKNLVEDTEKLRELSSRKSGIEEKMEIQKEKADSARDNIVSSLKESWDWMIAPTVLRVQQEVKEAEEPLINKEKVTKGQEAVITYIKKAIDDVYCPVCEHKVTPPEKLQLEQRLISYQQLQGGLTTEEKTQLKTLRDKENIFAKHLNASDQSQLITNEYEKYNNARVKYSDLKEHDLKAVDLDLEALKKNATGTDEKTAFEYYDKLINVGHEILIYQDGISKVDEEIEKIKKTISKLNGTIISKSKNKDVAAANRRVAFARAIADIFRKGIDDYRDKLSSDVEKDATDIFLAMNTEEDYAALKINENYGLSIIRADGKPVIKRSAGWEHMVAFALIGALHKNAPFNGPVIMDSPFYRLDNRNTASMVKALPMIANQVLMLPYPGEINASTTRTSIGPSIIQELEISRISANESEIKEMRDNGGI